MTLNYIREHIENQGPASVRICSLLDKPSRREVPVDIDYLGFTVDNVFIVGYGLDVAQRYRNLPYITSVRVEE
jgi:hypoxanthine phosphoribosyltransferase